MQHRIQRADLAKITSLIVTAAIMLLANGLQGTLVPIRGHLEGFSDTTLSFQGFAYFTGFMAGCLYAPMLIARSGHIRVFAVFTALTTAAVLLMPMIVGVWSWAILRVGIGFCAAGMYAIIEGWLNQQVPNEKRGRIFTMYAAINNLALLGGQYLFTLGDTRGDVLFMGCAILTVFCLIPIGLTRQTEPTRVALPKLRVAHLYKVSPVGVVGAAIVGLASGAFWILAPVYANDRGLTGDGVALFMAAVILGGALAQWPLGRLSDFTDRRLIIGAASAVAAFAGITLAIPVPFAIEPHYWLLAGAVLYGASAFPIGALTNAHLNDHAKREEMTETAASNLFVYGVAAMLGPLIAAAVINVGGLSAVFYYTATMHTLLLLFVIYRVFVRSAIPSEERGAFKIATTQGPGPIHFAPAPAPETAEQAPIKKAS